MEDLKESIAEVSEMEQIRIECEYAPPSPPRAGLPPPCFLHVVSSLLSIRLKQMRTEILKVISRQG